MSKIRVFVDGREIILSEQDLNTILEEHFFSKNAVDVGIKEGQWFEVKPQEIDWSLFEEARKDYKQEQTRLLILEAYKEMKKNPEKYRKNFETLIPKKKYTVKTVTEIKEMASEFGGYIANWVEQAIEWAQRIENGESWEVICNLKDTAKWNRLVVWRNGYARMIGGASKVSDHDPASNVDGRDYYDNGNLDHVVPLIVRYK